MSNLKKLLILTDTYVGLPGGSERHLHNFLTSISDDFQVDVIQLIPTGNPMLIDGPLIERSNVTLHSRPLVGVKSKNMLYLIIELWKLIRKNKVDLVISYHEKSDIINYILTLLPGIYFKSVSSKRDMGFKLEGNLKRVMHFITPKLKNITAPSRSIAKQMIDEFAIPEHDTHVIPNGVDLATYKINTPERCIVLKDMLGLPKNAGVICSVGWLKPVKGHRYLLDAFSLFTKNNSGKWVLVLLGEGELEEELKSQAKKLSISESIFFVGFQSPPLRFSSASELRR